ncbi:anthranilate synthase component II [Mariniblastus fucicola]|uniref:Aminodeoxychorismate/anthranilate synthase component 2 n=1 Tax=Mariniblastus fucicola TaxID=980251 RepID=A0A5B9PFM7_9BACT|nr:aminodeoxychorismate/anthranilate synthase component II [Mariniblastus fucicola]QEG23436.1 Aminodeoxychorismate/anthranilate synthase component 2 [Mariniblastus fucicola]
MILVIDNYDSFVHNLARYFRQLGCQTVTMRNDDVDRSVVEELAPTAIVISPGPCSPGEAGYSIDCVTDFADSIPILGVCLGHQGIVQAFGGDVIRSGQPMHGRQSEVQHNGGAFFGGIPENFKVGRYHSLIATSKSMPDCLEVTARLDDGTIMAVQHRSRPVIGVQFHPESILTEFGHQMLANFCSIAGMESAVKNLQSKNPTL